ncbi:MAG: hypothetical protein GY929_27080, partial [Actinomycetia bacterium]|nr:hypothetical protein [Actinomycetes bacterium]
TPLIEIDGTALGGVNPGIDITAAASTVRGLAVGGFPADGIGVKADNVVVVGNHIGVDALGNSDFANAAHGIAVSNTALNVTIGGSTAADRNVIGFNGGAGISVDNVDTTVIIGNYIGVQADGTSAAANDRGVSVANAVGVRIGSAATGEANTIANNTKDGVTVTTGSLPSITANSIYANGDLGIDHDDDGVSANDVGDADAIPNAPVLISAVNNNGVTTVEFLLDVAAGNYQVDFYLNPSGADPSGYGEGEQYVSAVTLVHDGSGSQMFSHAFGAGAGASVSATSSLAGPPTSATSEFSGVNAVTALTSATIPDSGVRRSNFSGAGGLDPTSPAAGAAGVALDVNGGSERAVGPGLDIVANELSFSAWVRLDASGAQHAVISKQDQAGNPIYELAVDG